jgi:pyruvate dehydrogenase E1 component beta subunit
VLFFEHVLLYNLKEDLPEEEYLLPLDKAEVVRKGNDVTILTYSRMRHHVMQAVRTLEKEGYDPEVIDLISLKPLDFETIGASIRKTHRVIIVEECMKTGGIAAEVIASINERLFDELDAPVLRLSSQDIPTPYNGTLENLTIVQPPQIVEAVQKMVALRV